MFFLLRLAFWLGLVLVLLPREKTPESEKLPQITASEAVQAATAAVPTWAISASASRRLRRRRPSGHHHRPSCPGRRTHAIPDHHRQDVASAVRPPREVGKKGSEPDRRSPEHTGSSAAPAIPVSYRPRRRRLRGHIDPAGSRGGLAGPRRNGSAGTSFRHCGGFDIRFKLARDSS